MHKLILELPSLYGDHHVIAVRRLLLDLPGVNDVYASSAFRSVEIDYDPSQINDLEIQVKLDEAGYLGEWTPLAEPGEAVTGRKGSEEYFRHTAVYEQTRQVIGFAQSVAATGRPLWPCPGMGVIREKDLEG